MFNYSTAATITTTQLEELYKRFEKATVITDRNDVPYLEHGYRYFKNENHTFFWGNQMSHIQITVTDIDEDRAAVSIEYEGSAIDVSVCDVTVGEFITALIRRAEGFEKARDDEHEANLAKIKARAERMSTTTKPEPDVSDLYFQSNKEPEMKIESKSVAPEAVPAHLRKQVEKKLDNERNVPKTPKATTWANAFYRTSDITTGAVLITSMAMNVTDKEKYPRTHAFFKGACTASLLLIAAETIYNKYK